MIRALLALLARVLADPAPAVDDVDLVPDACDDCGYPMGYCCCVPDDERCTAWSQKTVDQAGNIGGAGERCPDRATTSGGSFGGGLPPTSWAYCIAEGKEN